MNPFTFERLSRPMDAASAVAARPGAMFLAGGTTLVDLMKVDVLTPDTVVDVRHLGLSSIVVSDQAIAVGAAVTNSQLAWHPVVRDRFPVLSEAILSGATTQIRNMATVAGNLLQRTRCSYFRDVHASCNRRQPGSGCDALEGFNRGHAVLGVSDQCIATHPSDMCVAMQWSLTPSTAWPRLKPSSASHRSEERRVGKECGYQCRSRWSPYH